MIPIYKPYFSGKERDYVLQCLDSSWISSKGEFIDRFETGFACYIGVKHATSVCNGTVALHLALLALGIGPGDEVIVPTLTYIASVNAISYVGATPVFVDSLLSTWQMDPEEVKKKITPKTKAILVVHLYGHPCDMANLCEIAQKHDLFVIEDCAEAFGSYYQNQHVGTFGDIATFSFFGNKTITTGEGGMVVCNDDLILNKSKLLKNQGNDPTKRYWHNVIGYNYRMTNIAAAIGLAQLEKAEDIIKAKRKIAQKYSEEFENTSIKIHTETHNTSHSYWMISVLAESAALKTEIMTALEKNNIETRPVFYPIHTMPPYSDQARYPNAEVLSSRGMNLPSWPELTENDIIHISSIIKSVVS